MGKKFTVQTWVKKGLDRVDFAPGDDVPEWAEELVGDHVYEERSAAASGRSKTASKAESTDEDPEPETATEAPEEADFTRPATRRKK